ncbi:MAG: antibiotic biosynthesis monooxygenase family protein [Rudaea sp.]
MYSVDFIFEPGVYDERFHELNAIIDAAARATPGYLGVESWRSPDGSLRNAKYYWETLDALRAFSRHPQHLQAKREYQKWYRGYHIIIAQVIKSYGDGAFAHVTPNEPGRLA